MNFFQIGGFLRFFRNAVTKYQLHSSFVFDLACAVVEDKRWFYAFRDVEGVRQKMLTSDVALNLTANESGTGAQPSLESRHQSVQSLARDNRISAKGGQLLFRLTNHLQPKTMLELGTSLGVGTMYLASAAREARFISLEVNSGMAAIARINLELLGLDKKQRVIEGDLERNFQIALQELKQPDLIFFNACDSPEKTLRCFEASLAFSHLKTAFVFSQPHYSKDMLEAWTQIKAHPRVTLTLDFFELSLVFIDPDFRERQHFNILPARWKPWMFF
jgi:predicted O-methyltransferase YrrM